MAVRTTVVAGTAAAVGAHAANRRAETVSQQAPPPAAPAPPPAPAPDLIGQLTQLAALKDSGALTEAEFETQKARILG
ncbi:MAG TPA: SHOCT domain-containing protein [Acidimicrobiales bacterium]|nr:SHOCT domain-containing protein [Acidimicrobiales bacterium]